MERDDNDTVDLGAASELTRGGDYQATESGGKLPFLSGIADDD
ncbi:benenodin family lasso peptide [Sphingomonas donggukensis]|uniref:Benenodin family lasso peptide n=1 Tax=Sphingomonas donggukensis TaxID=2949093 RepID=A0ABY4TZB9_9SPHN|nr:benenodin family lasso peptide [Sphingomonas donggukensis]URW75891.1 benenodin family lasso peptide [Sphingomonas donggukensis]